jgi:asparagine synthase (glutamine-hydrolysing)
MCGIVGLVSSELLTVNRDDLTRKMLSTIHHRGPDDSGISSHHQTTIGMVRLSIVDIGSGSQPMKLQSCKDNLEIVFNGEIYNHKELRKNLHNLGHRFNSSHSDTEVILHAYEEWGADSFSKLNGMFSIAILEADSQTITLARDAFGEKPLYIYQSDTLIAFSSEVKAIVEVLGLKGNFNFEIIENYLADGCNYSSDSFFNGVTKLNPGWMARISLSSHPIISLAKYRKYSPSEEVMSLPTNSNLAFEKLLVESVKKRLETDVETGVYLSGGLDSSAIACIAKSLSPSIESFSVGFSYDDFNEANQARDLANFLGIKNSQVICDESYAITFLDNLPNILDEPMADPSIIPTTLLSEFASQKIKVALGGDGSDEIGYGYKTFKQFSKIDLVRRVTPKVLMNSSVRFLPPGRIKRRLINILDILDFNESELVAKSTSPLFRYLINADLNSRFLPLKSGISKSNPTGLFEDKIIDAYVSTYMREQILTKIDRASMYSSVELRSPFLDYDLAAYMSVCDKSFKFKHGLGKLPLRSFLNAKVPMEVLARPKKGFGIPLNSWLEGEFGKRIIEAIVDGDWSGTPFDNGKIEKLANTLKSSRGAQPAEYLWCLAVFQIWRHSWS